MRRNGGLGGRVVNPLSQLGDAGVQREASFLAHLGYSANLAPRPLPWFLWCTALFRCLLVTFQTIHLPDPSRAPALCGQNLGSLGAFGSGWHPGGALNPGYARAMLLATQLRAVFGTRGDSWDQFSSQCTAQGAVPQRTDGEVLSDSLIT